MVPNKVVGLLQSSWLWSIYPHLLLLYVMEYLFDLWANTHESRVNCIIVLKVNLEAPFLLPVFRWRTVGVQLSFIYFFTAAQYFSLFFVKRQVPSLQHPPPGNCLSFNSQQMPKKYKKGWGVLSSQRYWICCTIPRMSLLCVVDHTQPAQNNFTILSWTVVPFFGSLAGFPCHSYRGDVQWLGSGVDIESYRFLTNMLHVTDGKEG